MAPTTWISWVVTCNLIQHYTQLLDECYDDEGVTFLKEKIRSLHADRQRLEQTLN